MLSDFDNDPASRATEILKAFELWRLPVDPLAVCKLEDIEVAPGEYGHGFDGRIRYLREANVFALAYQVSGTGRPLGRVHFTIAHELGHYYLHRTYLLGGHSHNSKADFTSKDAMESEADEFAASLLMPFELFRTAVKEYRQSVCTLRELCELAGRLGTSVTSTARRYCQADIEPCAIVFSQSGTVQWACYSEDMRRLGMGFIPFGRPLPRASLSAKLFSGQTTATPCEGAIDPSVWFDRSFHRGQLWEEAISFGDTGFGLSYLTLIE